jgi:hypothetical protein
MARTKKYMKDKDRLKYYYTIVKNPFMYDFHKWWFVIKNDEDYVFDIIVSTDELYELYGEVTGLDFNDFLMKAKAGELDLTKYKFND